MKEQRLKMECNQTESITAYVDYLKALAENREIQTMPSVEAFRKYVFQNPIIRSQFQLAINQIPQEVLSFEIPGKMRPGILHGMTINQVLDLYNIAVQTPPKYSSTQLCAIPFTILRFDLANTQMGQALFARSDVNQHLKNIFDEYAVMLQSQKSLKHLNREQGGWFCESACQFVDYNDILCDPDAPHFGFKSWNEWFTREFKAEARPIDGVDDQAVIINANQNYPLTNATLPARNLQATDQFWLKETKYSLYDMFEAQKMGIKQIIDQSFVGGCLYQGFLTAWCYHRWHAPVDGTIEKVYRVPGSYFLQNPSFNAKEILNFRRSQPFLGHVATRQIVIINTHTDRVGRVAIIEIGMGEVSSCISTVKQGDVIGKGDVMGRFELGGSSHIIVFDRRAKVEFNPSIFERQTNNGWEVSKLQKINTWLARVLPQQS